MIITLLILSVLIGILLGKYFGEKTQLTKVLLMISAGFLITICLNDIFPQVYQAKDLNLGIWIIGGVLLQLILENLTKGFEHGHTHHQSEHIIPLTLMIGLFIHAFIEGIPLANETDFMSPYLQGIFLHKIPISFVLGTFLFKNKKFSSLSWIIAIIFALASPLAIIIGQYFPVEWELYFLALTGGIFLHISSVIIFESNKNHNIDWQKITWVVFGIALALFTHLFHHH